MAFPKNLTGNNPRSSDLQTKWVVVLISWSLAILLQRNWVQFLAMRVTNTVHTNYKVIFSKINAYTIVSEFLN